MSSAQTIVINCAGLGSRELASDPMFPLRGALVRLVNDGKNFPKITRSYCVSHDDVTSDQEIVFIVPRGENRLILGALVEPDEWSTDINLDNHEPIRRLYERCVEFLPILQNARLDSVEPVRVGLRPFRKQSVRVEQAPGTAIFHNYGHGGAGVTFSWGCAEEVAKLVKGYLSPTDEDSVSARPPSGDFGGGGLSVRSSLGGCGEVHFGCSYSGEEQRRSHQCHRKLNPGPSYSRAFAAASASSTTE